MQKHFGRRAGTYVMTVLMLLAVAMAGMVQPIVESAERARARARRRAILRGLARTGDVLDPRLKSLIPAGAMARYSERNSIVYLLQPKDHGGAAATGESINMGKLRRIMFILAMGTLGTGNPALTLKSGASDGVETTAETFRYRLADAAHKTAGADNYADWATSSSLSLVAATYAETVLIIEIDSDELTDGQPWLTLSLSNVTAVTCSVVAIGEPRFEANDVPTVI